MFEWVLKSEHKKENNLTMAAPTCRTKNGLTCCGYCELNSFGVFSSFEKNVMKHVRGSLFVGIILWSRNWFSTRELLEICGRLDFVLKLCWCEMVFCTLMPPVFLKLPVRLMWWVIRLELNWANNIRKRRFWNEPNIVCQMG